METQGAPNGVPGWLERVALGAMRHPGRVFGFWLAVAAIALLGAAQLRIETSTDSVLDRTHPDWQRYRESVELFGGDEVVVVAITGERPWDPDVLAEVARLTSELEAEEHIRRVDSIASVPVIRGTPDGGLQLDPALPADGPFDEAGAVRVRHALEGDRIAPGLLVSHDGRTFSITNIVEDVGAEFDLAVLAAIERAEPRLPIHVSGGPVFRTQVGERTRSELAVFVPITALLITLLVLSVVPSARAVAAPLLTGSLASIVVFGAMGALGVPLTLMGAILPSVMLGLGCAYVLHIVVAFTSCEDDPDARARKLAELVRPISLSGLTTAIGFGAMALVRIDVVRQIGGFGALGTVVVTAAALSFAPALLAGGLGRQETRFGGWLRTQLPRRASDLVVRHGRMLVLGWTLVALLVGIGIARLQAETDVVMWFLPGSEVRQDYEAIRAELAGISPMNVVVEQAGTRPVTEPDVLAALAGLTAYLEAQPEMGRAISLADPLRQLNGGFRGDPSEPLPDTRALAEQYLLLLQGVEMVRDLVSSDRTATNVVLRVDDNGSADLTSLAERAEAWWVANGPADFRAHTTGIMHEYARSEDEIGAGQLRGLLFALIAIAVLLRAAAGSTRLALLALVPNVVPLILLFGTMGLLGIPLDAATVLIGCIALGIAVDDTIHLVTAFERERWRRAADALRAAFAHTLPAITLTTAAVALGFAVLGLSEFTLVRNLGILTSTVMLACYLADVLLLAPLLLFSFGATRTARTGSSSEAGPAGEGPSSTG